MKRKPSKILRRKRKNDKAGAVWKQARLQSPDWLSQTLSVVLCIW